MKRYLNSTISTEKLINDVDMMFLNLNPAIQMIRATGPSTIHIGGYRETVSSQPLSRAPPVFNPDIGMRANEGISLALDNHRKNGKKALDNLNLGQCNVFSGRPVVSPTERTPNTECSSLYRAMQQQAFYFIRRKYVHDVQQK
ncbi:hypothetical protein NQ318_021873 [Aromia moschata]|uniref:Uncharacterized protein n=1 Tax=Aromia moschata TaxID=1265417 RepID=A0AAV8Z723_9CUCU|nr:hypothetical protein NQ318_021873 [Aromia moschata]